MNHAQTTSTFTPPTKLACRFLLSLKILSFLTIAALLAACPPPSGGGTPPPETYTTTVSGKVITPARAADPAKGSTITTARVWSSIDPAEKVAVGADGSYTLQVAGHSGSFTITAEYTATDGNYRAGDPKTVSTKGAAIENQDIALKYGHTTEFTVKASLNATTTSGGTISSCVTVVITAEGDHEIGRGITSGNFAATGVLPSAVITVDHPGEITATVSRDGYRSNSNSSIAVRTTERTRDAGTAYLYQSL